MEKGKTIKNRISDLVDTLLYECGSIAYAGVLLSVFSVVCFILAAITA